MIKQLQDVIWDVKRLPKVPYYPEKGQPTERWSVRPLQDVVSVHEPTA